MRYIATQGIVLTKRPVGEYDQFITIYSPDLGKIQARARASRKINSTFTGHLESGNICSLQLYKSTFSYTLIQCQNIETFRKIRDSLELSAFSFLILELFEKTAGQDEEGSKELFELLALTLRTLTTLNSAILIESFKIKLLSLAGALPHTSECTTCHKRWQENSTIVYDTGGHLFCAECSPPHHSTAPLSFNLMKLIHFISTAPYQTISTIRILPSETAQLKNIINLFLGNYINTEIQSQKLMDKL